MKTIGLIGPHTSNNSLSNTWRYGQCEGKLLVRDLFMFSPLPYYGTLYIPLGSYVYRVLWRSLSDLNECLEANRPNCTNGTTCINTWGSAECVCPGNRYGSACQYCKNGHVTVTHIHSSDHKIAKTATLNFSATIYDNACFMIFTILIKLFLRGFCMFLIWCDHLWLVLYLAKIAIRNRVKER